MVKGGKRVVACMKERRKAPWVEYRGGRSYLWRRRQLGRGER